MAKKIRLLAITAIVILMLGGTFFILNMTEPEEEVIERTQEYLIDKSRDEIVSMEIINPYGNAVITPKGSTWQVAPYEHLEANFTTCWDYATSISSVTPTYISDEENLDLSVYGLDSIEFETIITYSDGEIFHLKIGDVSPDNIGRYCMVEGDDNVYVVSSTEYEVVLGDPLNLLDRQVTRLQDGIDDMPTWVEFDSYNEDDDPIVFTRLDDTLSDGDYNKIHYTMTSPSFNYFMTRQENTSISLLMGLEAEYVAYTEVTDEVLAETGLDKPYAVTYDLDGVRHVLEVGDIIDGMRMVRFDKGEAIYAVNPENLPWYGATFYDLGPKYPYAPLLSELETITISAKDYDDVLIEIDGDSKETYTSVIDGQNIDYTEFFKPYYRILNHYYGDEPAVDGQIGELLYTMTFNYEDPTKEDIVVNLYYWDVRKVAIEINGVINYTMSDQFISRVYTDLELIKDGFHISNSY